MVDRGKNGIRTDRERKRVIATTRRKRHGERRKAERGKEERGGKGKGGKG